MTPKPPYKRIMDFLREELKNKYSPGDKIPSENELAKLFGVSRLTARKAVEKLVAEGLLIRIPGLGTFVSEISKFSNEKLLYVGVAIESALDTRGQTLISNIAKTLRNFSTYAIFTNVKRGDRKNLDKKLHQLLEENIEGLIISPPKELSQSYVFQRFIEKKIPIVFIDRTIPNFEEIPTIESDNFHGGFLLGKHLKKVHNIKKALFVTEEDFDISSVKSRYEGFKKALRTKVDNFQVKNIDDLRTKLPGLIKENNYEAIFFCHDLLASAGITVLMSNNIHVPEEVKVVGFDDRIVTRYIFPKITTIRQNFEEMGKMAAVYLIKLLKKEELPKKELIPVELIIRESCGCNLS